MIGNENVLCNVQLVKVMEGNDLDQRGMENTIHLLLIPFSLNYVCHFLNTPEQIIRDIEHSNSCEVHGKFDMV